MGQFAVKQKNTKMAAILEFEFRVAKDKLVSSSYKYDPKYY